MKQITNSLNKLIPVLIREYFQDKSLEEKMKILPKKIIHDVEKRLHINIFHEATCKSEK